MKKKHEKQEDLPYKDRLILSGVMYVFCNYLSISIKLFK